MKRLRLSIGGMMTLVLVAGFGAAALARATAVWASLTFVLALAILLGATLGAIVYTGARRLARAGFAAFGWTYLVLAFGPLAGPNGLTAPPLPALIAYEPIRAAITPVVQQGDPSSVTILDSISKPEPLSFSGDRASGMGGMGGMGGAIAENISYPIAQLGGAGGAIPGRVVDYLQLRRILQALGAIAFGLIGAAVGGFIAVRSSPAGRGQG